ncbi:hypothetical protein [Larkinella terrae]|uniref:Secreted protein n=1 Tax=Larkinella terrae TaxID=2025311 RepID=A0A7K0EMX3_9BACT|nr:hypothetical protein [Larkinella terrae]MRS62826.1 hypothetical protein [Larkinella terrae]
MNRRFVILTWLLLVVAGSLVQAKPAVPAFTPDRSTASCFKSSHFAFAQPTDHFFPLEWVLPTDDNSSGNDQSTACGFPNESYFNRGKWVLASETAGFRSEPFHKAYRSTPLFVLFHTWKILCG